jgi:hypothetical protein
VSAGTVCAVLADGCAEWDACEVDGEGDGPLSRWEGVGDEGLGARCDGRLADAHHHAAEEEGGVTRHGAAKGCKHGPCDDAAGEQSRAVAHALGGDRDGQRREGEEDEQR